MSEGILALLGRLDFGISEVPALSGSTARLRRLTMAEGRAGRSENRAGFSQWAMEGGSLKGKGRPVPAGLCQLPDNESRSPRIPGHPGEGEKAHVGLLDFPLRPQVPG